ncbi:MAG TPA: alpha/beta fold hydrolase [Burkholderiales bacterium]|nr:alpha/beta fold hydrolase [Burkholderiales bacterium]
MLELLAVPHGGAPARAPLVFVHGAYVGAWCWEEHFLPWFAERGFPSYALSLRGHGKSPGREQLHSFGLADFADDLEAVLAGLDRPAVLIGHSMGALVVQKYLERGAGAALAAAFVCPVPPFGLLPSSFTLAWTRPALFTEINALAIGRRASRGALHEALFAGPVDSERIERYYARMQPESRRALLDMAGWGLPQTWRLDLPPALVMGAERDALIGTSAARTTAQLLGAQYRELPGLGHAVMLDPGWRTAAEALEGWLAQRGL